MAMTIALYQEAMRGNTKAYELIRNTLVEKIPAKVEINIPKIQIDFGDDSMEIWKNIQGFKNKYQISNYGRVKSLKDNKGRD